MMFAVQSHLVSYNSDINRQYCAVMTVMYRITRTSRQTKGNKHIYHTQELQTRATNINKNSSVKLEKRIPLRVQVFYNTEKVLAGFLVTGVTQHLHFLTRGVDLRQYVVYMYMMQGDSVAVYKSRSRVFQDGVYKS